MRQFNPIGIPSGSHGADNETMKQEGVSLIEMLAAVAIFAITVGAISGIFISAIRTQRRILAIQELLDQTSYVLEYMGRALRMARKELTPTAECPKVTTDCLSQAGLNYETSGNQDLRFLNYTCVCQRFFLEAATGRLKEQKGWTLSGGFPIGGTENYLTSDKLQVNSLKFNLSGESGSDTLQPRVTIFLEILGRGTTERPKIQIQTSISQRPLDVP